MHSEDGLRGTWRQFYLPHLRRPQVEQLLAEGLQTALVPVGSVEQHAEHLPLGTDFYGVEEVCKAAAERHPLLIVPAALVGVSSHHLGFPGTITLSPETLTRLLIEVAQSLAAHGLRNVAFVNGHGGNGEAVGAAVRALGNEGGIEPIAFPSNEQFRALFLEEFADYFDSHSGVEETSRALFAFPELVDLSKARRPELQLSSEQRRAIEHRKENPELYRRLITPLPPMHEVSDTGALTFLDIERYASRELGERNFERFVQALVQAVERLERQVAC